MAKGIKTATPDEFKIVDEWAKLMPPITHETEEKLIEDIKKNGIRVPVDVLPDMTLIDGFQRRRIIKQNPELKQKIPYRVRDDLKVENIPEWIIKTNLLRRHLSYFRRVQLVTDKAEEWGWKKEGQGQRSDLGEDSSLKLGKFRHRVAKTFGVNEDAVKLYERLKAEKESAILVSLLNGEMKMVEAQKKLDTKSGRKKVFTKPNKNIILIPMKPKRLFDARIEALKRTLWTPGDGDTLRLVYDVVTTKKVGRAEKPEKPWKPNPFREMACVHGVAGGCDQCYRDGSFTGSKKSPTIKQDGVNIPVGKEEMASFRVLPDREMQPCHKCHLFDSMNGLCRIKLGEDKVPKECRKWRK